MTPIPSEKTRSPRQRLRDCRHKLYELLPFVKRKRYRKCLAELDAARSQLAEKQTALHDELQPVCTALLSLPGSFANKTGYKWIKPATDTITPNELCLFVSHAPDCNIKPHAVDHINALIAEGIAVVLIVNTNLTHDSIRFPHDLMLALHGCIVRENAGYDFGAWAHTYSLIDSVNVDRLFLINDSIIGPLDNRAYSAMISRIRSSNADMVGLTQNRYPKWHLQSFFLVFNKHLLKSHVFTNLLQNMVNLPTKEAVINVYETQISCFLLELGFQCKTVFPYLDPHSPAPDDTHARWAELIEGGFPFIKASVFKEVRNQPKAIKLIPSRYREATTAPPAV